MFLFSDAEEDLPAIHPEQDEPIDRQRDDAKDKRLKGCSEHLKDPVAEIDMQVAANGLSE